MLVVVIFSYPTFRNSNYAVLQNYVVRFFPVNEKRNGSYLLVRHNVGIDAVKPHPVIYKAQHICAAFRPVDNRLYSVYSAACIFNFEQRHFSELIFNTDNVLQIIIRYAL